MTLINKETGKEPTPQEWVAIRRRAEEIFTNPYATPEQLEWAVNVHPEGILACVPYRGAFGRGKRA